MNIASISKAGTSKRPDHVPLPVPPTDYVDVTQRSRSPPPSPHLPKQHLQTPGPTRDSVARTNGEQGRSSSPSLLGVPMEEEHRIQVQGAKPQSLCSSCAPNARLEAKYTCPRCGIKSCSVGCSRKHKEASGCSGERNKVAYVPMKEYGWGSMMNDYTFLEDIGRKVGELGREIMRGGYSHSTSLSHPSGRGGAALGRGRGAGPKRGRVVGGKTKRDVWKLQMELRDVDVDLLPLGMKRRKANQSSWDFRNQAALLTIELKIHPPSRPSSHDNTTPPSSPKPQTSQPLTILTHRTSSSQSLSHIIHSLVLDRSKKEGLKGKPTEREASNSCPEWLKTMILVPPETTKAKPKMVMRAPVDPVLILNELKREVEESKGEREYKSGLGKLLSSRLAAYARPTPSTTTPTPLKRKHATPYPAGFKFPKVYYALDSEKTLLDALRHTTFVEYPTIEVYEEGNKSLEGCLFVQPGKLGVQGGVVRSEPVGPVAGMPVRPRDGMQPQRKRRKLDPKEAKEKIKGLVGDYGSDSESEGGEDGREVDVGKKGVGSLLGDYDASDEDEQPVSASVLDGDMTMAAPADDGLHDDDAEGEDDPDHLEQDADLDDEDEEELDPATLLELVRKVKGEQWVKEQERMEEDVLDWDGSDADLDAEGEVDDEEEDT